MKKHKKILTCISLKRYLRGVGMNNYWNHEPEFFWYKKKVRKSQEFLTQRSDPPRVDFLKKISDVIFYGPLQVSIPSIWFCSIGLPKIIISSFRWWALLCLCFSLNFLLPCLLFLYELHHTTFNNLIRIQNLQKKCFLMQQ